MIFTDTLKPRNMVLFDNSFKARLVHQGAIEKVKTDSCDVKKLRIIRQFILSP